VALNLAVAPRQGVEYSIQGFATPGALTLADPGPACTGSGSGGSISTQTYNDMIGVLPSSATPCPNIASVRVCTMALGVTNPGTVNQAAQCSPTYGPAPSTAFPAPDPDPEAPYFMLHRVAAEYTVKPLIPGGSGNFFRLFIPPLNFRRQVSMRAMD